MTLRTVVVGVYRTILKGEALKIFLRIQDGGYFPKWSLEEKYFLNLSNFNVFSVITTCFESSNIFWTIGHQNKAKYCNLIT